MKNINVEKDGLSLGNFLEILNSFIDEDEFNPKFVWYGLIYDDISKGRSQIYDYLNCHKESLEEAIKGTPKKFQDYICNNKTVGELTEEEVLPSVARYAYFYNLHSLFEKVYAAMSLNNDDLTKMEGQTFEVMSTNTLIIRQAKLNKKQTIIELHPKRFVGDTFNEINLNRLKRCALCHKFFYAKKDDDRIKFCSTRCGSTLHVKNFLNRKKKSK